MTRASLAAAGLILLQLIACSAQKPGDRGWDAVSQLGGAPRIEALRTPEDVAAFARRVGPVKGLTGPKACEVRNDREPWKTLGAGPDSATGECRGAAVALVEFCGACGGEPYAPVLALRRTPWEGLLEGTLEINRQLVVAGAHTLVFERAGDPLMAVAQVKNGRLERLVCATSVALPAEAATTWARCLARAARPLEFEGIR